MSSGDWLRPDRLADAVRAWTPGGLLPPSMTQAMRPIVELFGFAPATLAQDLIESAASRLVGRPLTLQSGATEIALVLRRLQLERAPLGLAIGQLGDVGIEADDVVVGDVRIAHLRLGVRNVHVQPGVTTATIVAAPIQVRAILDQEVVATAVARRTPHVEVELCTADRARARLRAHPEWGSVDLTPRIDGRTLVLDPARATLRRWDLTALARRLPAIRFALPDAIAAARVTAVHVEDGQLVIDGTYEEWRAEVGPTELDDLRRRVKLYDHGPLRVPSPGPHGNER
jgi:hypothetical protein